MSGGEFGFDGRGVRFQPGQTVGAALWADGVRSWRTTRGTGRPRGLFCGIGTCFDCLVTVDGEPNQRACLLPAAAGLDIRTQHGTGHGTGTGTGSGSGSGSGSGDGSASGTDAGQGSGRGAG